MKYALLTATLFMAPGVQAQEMDPHVPDLEELFALELAGNPVISPDGEHVIYTKQVLDFGENVQLSQMWLADVDGDRHLQLTFGKKSVGNLTWSPDSQSVAFTRDGKIHLMALAGGEASVADTKLKGIGGLQFSDDGNYLYFIANQDREKDLSHSTPLRLGQRDQGVLVRPCLDWRRFAKKLRFAHAEHS